MATDTAGAPGMKRKLRVVACQFPAGNEPLLTLREFRRSKSHDYLWYTVPNGVLFL